MLYAHLDKFKELGSESCFDREMFKQLAMAFLVTYGHEATSWA